MYSHDNDKSQRRHAMLQRRNALPGERIRRIDQDAPQRILPFLREHLPSGRAVRVMSYSSFRNEFPTTLLNEAILRAGWELVLPFTDREMKIHPLLVRPGSPFKTSSLGISEPDPAFCEEVDPASISLILIPGVAFDLRGYRIGFGAGCYDQFLPLLMPDTPVIALAHEMQILERVPEDAHDIPCDHIITESRNLSCRR